MVLCGVCVYGMRHTKQFETLLSEYKLALIFIIMYPEFISSSFGNREARFCLPRLIRHATNRLSQTGSGEETQNETCN